MLDNQAIPVPLFALVLTAIQQSLEEYQTGYRVIKDFRANDVQLSYRRHLAGLEKVQKESGEWLPTMLHQLWKCIVIQTKPGFLDVLDHQDIEKEFEGVDFQALANSVPPTFKSSVPALPTQPNAEQ
ncbi:hypothetical protein ONZ45_g19616 [Pleurotus djamor]|nr:hypothetical protein ONZ45_g19616 [Pleurotus djamor]